LHSFHVLLVIFLLSRTHFFIAPAQSLERERKTGAALEMFICAPKQFFMYYRARALKGEEVKQTENTNSRSTVNDQHYVRWQIKDALLAGSEEKGEP